MDRRKKFFLNLFLRSPKKIFEELFFLDYTCNSVLGLCPWRRAFLSLASIVFILRRAVLGLSLRFFLCPWPRALCLQLQLCLLLILLQSDHFFALPTGLRQSLLRFIGSHCRLIVLRCIASCSCSALLETRDP